MKYVYWDSCCFISLLKDDKNGPVLRSLARRALNRELTIVTSSFSIVEVLKIAHDQKVDEEVQAKIVDAMSPDKGVIVVDVSRHIAEFARSFMWKHSYGAASFLYSFLPLSTPRIIHLFSENYKI